MKNMYLNKHKQVFYDRICLTLLLMYVKNIITNQEISIINNNLKTTQQPTQTHINIQIFH